MHAKRSTQGRKFQIKSTKILYALRVYGMVQGAKIGSKRDCNSLGWDLWNQMHRRKLGEKGHNYKARCCNGVRHIIVGKVVSGHIKFIHEWFVKLSTQKSQSKAPNSCENTAWSVVICGPSRTKPSNFMPFYCDEIIAIMMMKGRCFQRRLCSRPQSPAHWSLQSRLSANLHKFFH